MSRQAVHVAHWRCACIAAFVVSIAGCRVASAADGCVLPEDGRRAHNAEGTDVLVYRFEPGELKIDRHFSMLIETCPRSATAELRVDATMPAHRHGMNYKASVTRIGAGRWRAEGLLLHMPGEWQFRFEIRDGDRTGRLSDTVIVG